MLVILNCSRLKSDFPSNIICKNQNSSPKKLYDFKLFLLVKWIRTYLNFFQEKCCINSAFSIQEYRNYCNRLYVSVFDDMKNNTYARPTQKSPKKFDI